MQRGVRGLRRCRPSMGICNAPSNHMCGMRWSAQVYCPYSSLGALAVETSSRRNLGRHISFVQGLFNDTWSEENLAAFTSSPGNQLLNSRTLEYHVPQSVLKPNPQSSFEDKEKYITAK